MQKILLILKNKGRIIQKEVLFPSVKVVSHVDESIDIFRNKHNLFLYEDKQILPQTVFIQALTNTGWR